MAKYLFGSLAMGAWLISTVVAHAQTPVAQYDGTYSGELTDATKGTSTGGRCGEAFHKTLTIKNGAFSLAYNVAHNEYIKGTIAPDGTFSAFSSSSTGGNRFTGKIVGSTLSGEVTSGICTYTVRFTRG